MLGNETKKIKSKLFIVKQVLDTYIIKTIYNTQRVTSPFMTTDVGQ